MPSHSLEDLQRRIDRQNAELQALRQELSARQNELATLTRRKENLLAQFRDVDAAMAALAAGPSRPAPPSRPPPAASSPPPSPSNAVQPAQQPLHVLLVSLIREAGRPMTATTLADEARRRGFQSASDHFTKIVQTRLYDLTQKGILKRAGNDKGYVVNARFADASKAPAPPAKKPAANPTSTASRGRASNGRTKKAVLARRQAPATGGDAEKPVPLRLVLRRILQKSGQPLNGRELGERALRAGYRTTSARFRTVVAIALGKMDDVEHVAGQGYRLKTGKG